MTVIIHKLIAAGVALVFTIVMVVTVTYAWGIISTAPAVDGMQVSVATGNYILVAPNKTESIDGVTYNFPGVFDGSLNFNLYDEYGYLNDIAPLAPVSTVDGRNWIIPSYYNYSDREVQNGEAAVGYLKPTDDFTVDTVLSRANLTSNQAEYAKNGHYVYLDFWVVSPKDDYVLRFSRGDDGGCFAIELPYFEENDDGSGYAMLETSGSVASSIRVGMMTNNISAGKSALDVYLSQEYANENFKDLKGVYSSVVRETLVENDERFIIYEPNGDVHPDNEKINGKYSITYPLTVYDGKVINYDIRDKVSVQYSSRLVTADNGNGTVLEQDFQTAVWGKSFSDSSEANNLFYGKYVQGQFLPYISTGHFAKFTEDLYDIASSSNEDEQTVYMAGATDDIYITVLKENVPQRIRMFVWIEGQDVDCTNIDDSRDIVLGLELAGGSQ